MVNRECPLPAPPPQCQRLLAILATQPGGGFHHHAEQHGAVVVCQLNQPGFDDEAAQFDQMPGAFAALHLPFPRVMPRRLSLESVERLP